ncbi:hypothetical protein ACFX2I_039641 [Malus domestica]
MASFSFNTTKIRTPTLHSHKPISKFISRAKPIRIPSPLSTNPSKPRPKLCCFRPNSISEISLSTTQEADEEELDEVDDDPTAELSYLDPETDSESISEWELDFCSRPILDIRGKKV